MHNNRGYSTADDELMKHDTMGAAVRPRFKLETKPPLGAGENILRNQDTPKGQTAPLQQTKRDKVEITFRRASKWCVGP
jgi:hypothetical protein